MSYPLVFMCPKSYRELWLSRDSNIVNNYWDVLLKLTAGVSIFKISYIGLILSVNYNALVFYL